MRRVFVDLGANSGEVSKNFSQENPDFEIFCVEANKGLIPDIVERSAACGRMFQVMWAAAWTSDGTIDLFQSGHDAASTVVAGKVEHGEWPQIDYSQGDRVPCFDFGGWLLRNFSLQDEVVVKMDIEGGEYDILEKMLADRSIHLVNKLFCEWHHDRFPGISAQRHEQVRARVGSATQLVDWT